MIPVNSSALALSAHLLKLALSAHLLKLALTAHALDLAIPISPRKALLPCGHSALLPRRDTPVCPSCGIRHPVSHSRLGAGSKNRFAGRCGDNKGSGEK